MASKFTKFLGSVADGIFSSRGDMMDYQHAARLFTDNLHRLSPKVEFLYHVFLDIDPAAIRAPGPFGFGGPEANIEAGMLVKNFQLPSVNIMTETKNQYGKKTNVQTAVQYQPLQITFHDDNAGLISGMWQQYFQSQYADSQFPEELKNTPTYNSFSKSTESVDLGIAGPARSATRTTTTTRSQNGYKFGFDNNKSVRFFRSIQLYQLSRKRFFEFTLINPMIQSWTAPNMNSASSQPAENQMTIIFEGIKYSTGNVSTNNPNGFAALHYDNTPSPLGGSTSGLFGAGGVLAGGLDVFGDILDPNVINNPFALVNTAIKAKQVYDGARQLSRDGIRNEIESIAVNSVLRGAQQTVALSGYDKLDQTQATNVSTTTTTVYSGPEVQTSINSGSSSAASNQNNITGSSFTTAQETRLRQLGIEPGTQTGLGQGAPIIQINSLDEANPQVVVSSGTTAGNGNLSDFQRLVNSGQTVNGVELVPSDAQLLYENFLVVQKKGQTTEPVEK